MGKSVGRKVICGKRIESEKLKFQTTISEMNFMKKKNSKKTATKRKITKKNFQNTHKERENIFINLLMIQSTPCCWFII